MPSDIKLRHQLFVTLGLSDKEAIIYDLLLTHGAMGSGTIERESRLKKNTYSLLRSLQRKNLVSISHQEGKRLYVPAPPTQLFISLKEQRRSLLQTQSLLESALPELNRTYHEQVGNPIIEHYTGKSGLKTVFDRVYAEDKDEIIGCVGWTKPSKTLEDIIAKYAPLRVERGIKAKAINNNTAAGRIFAKTAQEPKNLADVYLIDKDKYPMPAEIDVWNDQIAMMSFENKDFQAITIQHPEIAQSLASIFNLLFDLLDKKSL